ncbi:LamG domain-containing protein [Lacinutrix himadriensis]|uniref:LamG domain-containing protein n=1 Tax=Lacinutrix himadriensis TaxID=641549 RepID=UPI0006E448C3|nr:LamG-like jellyroll fold domain-containing protein [Lacinutrix himadriensis]
MKKLIILGCLSFLATGLWAQNDDGAKVVTVSQAKQNAEGANGNRYTLQVGVPYAVSENNNYDIRFPWDIKYLYGTFADESFDVSKGYFGDKILISWELRNNYDLITSLKIYRREYTDAGTNGYDFVSNVSRDVTQYEDQYIEGGVLYEYKIVADGVDASEIRYTNFITDLGFRNPTAIVTGNVSYAGGSPVKDVTILAESDGSATNLGSALKIPNNGFLEIRDMSSTITTAATLQAWLKPEIAFVDDAGVPIRLFRLKESTNTLDVNVRLLAASNALEVNIEGAIYTLDTYFPSGNIDPRGDDILVPVSDFNTTYTHFSIQIVDGQVPVLYINGRAINTEYSALMLLIENEEEESIYEGFNVVVPTAISTLTNIEAWTNVHVGGNNTAFIDEIRIWDAVIEDNIRTDYRRYISGNDSRLISYLSANEGAGDFAYDFSRNGFNYNKNNGRLRLNAADANAVLWENYNPAIPGSANNVPNASQLGVLGVTDDNGNYEITSIPYSGTGESFTITPLFNGHQFDPTQQLVFLGQGSEVVNQIDFVDQSSFVFKGKVLFDTRGVFPSYAEAAGGDLGNGNTIPGQGAIIDEGYNQYNILGAFYDKGEYWFNDAGTPADPSDDYLDKYATVASQGVQILIDGQLVLDENNQPVLTDFNGEFEINVPIGEHFIKLEKNGYEFEFNGRFPAESGTFYEFFEDALNQVVFIDNSRVTVVGRVVGGSVEPQKPIGFGGQGTYAPTYTDADGMDQTYEVSSKNNIGTATITLEYQPFDETRFVFETNAETGEYRKDILPINYTISQLGGVNINNNTLNISILDAEETLNAAVVGDLITPEFTYPNGDVELGDVYHHFKTFTYRSDPVLQVLEQTSDTEVVLNAGDPNEVSVSTEGFDHPIYTQFVSYEITLSSFERYVNHDSGSGVEDLVPIVDGELVVTNNLALPNSETTTRSETDQSIILYGFQAGMPNIFTPFTNTINISYNILGQNPAAENLITTGIILGGQSDSEQAFITTAPEIPDIILRDPPGSNSFASIQEGESVTFTKRNDFTSTESSLLETSISAGADFAFGGGLAGPVFTVDLTLDASSGVGVSTTSQTGKELTKTYTFSQAISTRSDPEFVGSEGDLYIGQSNNYYYGSYDNVQASAEVIGDSDYITLTNDNGDALNLSTQKALSFVEEPGATLFVYSQKYIIDTLIPDILVIINNIDIGQSIPGEDGVLERDFYVQQINLWRLTILKNEQSKYRALYDRENLKAETLAILDAYLDNIQDAIANDEDGPFTGDNFTSATNIRALIDANFAENISFDSGVGEIVRTVETIIVNNNSTFFNQKLDESIGVALGVEINGIGIENNIEGFSSKESNSELSESETSTVTVSYTFSDNDPANVLSVDVINMFDGYGPIFSTIGGRTSCPYEGAELSNYYDHAAYSSYLTTLQAYIDANPSDLYGPNRPVYSIPGLLGDDGEQLSFATQSAEDPQITVEIAEVFNVPESNNAEFTLLLQNLADATSDAASFNYFELAVVSGTNPFSADINLASNGTLVFVPYGETVEYTLTLAKVAEAQFDYEDIMIVVQSRCDPVNVFDQVAISAHFVPSCTEVEVSAPLENWVFNNDVAFNTDGSSNALNVTMTGFNQAFNSFKSIDLQYRISGSPTWTRLSTYYNTQELYDAALAAGETEIALIETPDLTFPFDIIGLQLQDGDYEFRAKSDCLSGSEYISEVITGSIDVNAPKRFGTPLPIDGTLSAGEDLKVAFNENVFYNNAISTIEITGETNQLPINNNVSLYFDGASNTATIENPRIITGDFSLEFWLKNETISPSATIMSQQNGMDVSLIGGEIIFTIGGSIVSGPINDDGLFHHYSFTHTNASGDLQIIEDATVIGTASGTPNAQFTNSSALVIGGNTFIGNIHDLRLWSKSLTLSESAANIFTKIIGNESNLLGFWPMNEGHGDIAYDLAFFKHAAVNTSWDIKPKGNSYEFASSQYLELDNVGFVQLNTEMDATLSFWVKTSTAQEATLFSNGKGDGTDVVQSNGFANKWAIDINMSGQLSLESEGNSSLLVSENVADGNWHHVALFFNRVGSLRAYLDGDQVSSNQMADIGGFSGNKAWLGARGSIDLAGIEIVDREFAGKIDEFRLWNTLRNVDQIQRDRYNEVDIESTGLLLYATMNAPDPATGNAPRYYHAFTNESIIPSLAVLNSGAVNYSNDVPPIKPARQLINFQVSYVINGDEIIIEPVINNWAELEGQILDITVNNMLDNSNNRQESPITWTAFVQQNDVDWYAQGYNDVVDIVMDSGEEEHFDFVIVNRGGNTQPYSITDVPSWLTISSASGSIAPNSQVTITATIDSQLSVGEYLENIRLETDFGFDQVIQLDLKVLSEGPDWVVNPNDFDYSMNIVGKIKVDGTFSDDLYDQVAAISNGEIRGSVNLIYQTNYQEYFVFLTVYSNSPSGDAIEFRIWDASDGNVLHATIGGNASVSFLDNEVVGTLNDSEIFENTDVFSKKLF